MRAGWCCTTDACISMIDINVTKMDDVGHEELTAPPRAPWRLWSRSDSALVPRHSIAARALVAVVAIMSFLASLTTGGVILVNQAANEWQADVSREVTIQIIPAPGRDIGRVGGESGVGGQGLCGRRRRARLLEGRSPRKLLEPWLGTGLTLEELPLPRLIVVKIASGATPDIPQLRAVLKEQVPGATLDDHRGWIDRMRAMAGSAVAVGIAILVLMIAATVLSVTFATRGAMATNKNVIEVLHFVGAKNSFIANNFQSHFLLLGLQGGAIGGGAAVLLFALASLISGWFAGTAGGVQTQALFGTFSIGWGGYAIMLLQVILIAGVTAFTSRVTVNHTLEAID